MPACDAADKALRATVAGRPNFHPVQAASGRAPTKRSASGIPSRWTHLPALERIVKIHQAVRDGGFPNAQGWARLFEVASKTIQRDLNFMRDRLELPLAYDPRHHGYYYTREVDTLPSFQISEGELFALLIAEKAMHQYRGTNLEKPLINAFQKIASALPKTVSLTLADWDQAISFRTSAEPLLDREIFERLARAASDGTQLCLSYRKPGGGAVEERVVDPYHLANINGEWFLFAYCHLRRDIRTFVPARIKHIAETGVKFKRPARFSLEKRLRDSFGVHSGQDEFTIVIQFTEEMADYIREKKWHQSQRLREMPDGGVELSLKLSSLAEIQRWILSWGPGATVVSPPQLVAAVIAAADGIRRRYSPRPRKRP